MHDALVHLFVQDDMAQSPHAAAAVFLGNEGRIDARVPGTLFRRSQDSLGRVPRRPERASAMPLGAPSSPPSWDGLARNSASSG